jgi:hypothetical protein
MRFGFLFFLFYLSICGCPAFTYSQDFKGLEYDFGVLDTSNSESSVLEHVFEIANDTNTKLEVTDVIASCVCIRVDEDANANLSIESNSTRKVKVLLDVTTQMGKVDHSIVLVSTGKVFRLRLTALKKGVWASPSKVDLGFVSGKKKLLATVLLLESGFSKGQVSSATSDNFAFEAVLGKLESNAGKEHTRPVAAVHITFDCSRASTHLGPQKANISVVFECGDGEEKVVIIPVSSVVVSEHIVTPKAIFFGNVTPGTKSIRQLSFEPNGRSTMKPRKQNLNIESDSDFITVSMSTDPENSARYNIMLSLDIPFDATFNEKLLQGNANVLDQGTVVVSVPYLAVLQPAVQKQVEGATGEFKKTAYSLKLGQKFGVPEVLSWFDSLSIPDSAPTWTMAHYVLAASELGGQKQKTIRRLLSTGTKFPAFEKSNNRYFGTSRGPFFERQHHLDQFLGYLSLSGVTTETSLTPTTNGVTIGDILEDAKWNTALRGEELSWKTIAFCRYEDKLGSKWKNKFSETVDLEAVIEKLISQDEPPCLGTHKTMAIVCYANLMLEDEARCSTNLKSKIEKYIKEKVLELKQTQRKDGAFDIPEQLLDQPFFLGIESDILYTGHTIEYLMVLETIDPNEAWVKRAIDFLCEAIQKRRRRLESLDFENENYCREFGQLCHAISGLRRWSTKAQTTRE